MSLEKLEKILDKETFEKIKAIDNPKLHDFLAKWIEHLNPKELFVITDNPEDKKRLREDAVLQGEEKKLGTEGHTIHFDAFRSLNDHDQARDKEHTKILRPEGMKMGKKVNAIDRKEGLEEVEGLMKEVMKDGKLYISFYCLGPTGSKFAIPALQLTDSSYVCHSEDILYRQGYEEFKKQGKEAEFFKFVHSQGEVEEGEHGLKTTKNLDKRRIYVDLQDNTVLSVNNQYAGNSVGLKKLALRLAINKAIENTAKHEQTGGAEGEPWLAEHMFVMGVNSSPELSSEKGRKTYFVGAYPSACGKTSTAMTKGNTIVGDDIAYFKVGPNGKLRAVNIEKGVFGIIRDVNAKDDPVIHKTITNPGETIFSNVLMKDGKTRWLGDGNEPPKEGMNYSGKWFDGKTDEQGEKITFAHKNARYTIQMKDLDNVDEALHDSEGVSVGGVVYGGRDSDTNVPVKQAFDWDHGIITMGAALESETTAATLGKQGERNPSPMANMDFIPVPVGRYIQANLYFGKQLKEAPPIFASNYFQRKDGKKDGKYLTGMEDKRVWLKWIELRANGDIDAIETPTGHFPKYEDLKKLFEEELEKEYTEEDYEEQFALRIPEHLEKIARIRKMYTEDVLEAPPVLFKVLDAQEKRLKEAREKFGEHVSPRKFEVRKV